MKNILKVVFVIIGTLIGAGFASGQEIYTFFFSHGIEGIYGIFISCILMGVILYKALTKIDKYNISTYKDFLDIIINQKKITNNRLRNKDAEYKKNKYQKSTNAKFGKKENANIKNKKEKNLKTKNIEIIKEVINNIINIFILVTFFIMIAGFGAYFEQELGINNLIGSSILAILCFIIFMSNVEGVIKASELLVPILIIFLIIVGVLNFNDIHFLNIQDYISKTSYSNFIVDAVIYSSYNSILLIPVLITLKNYLKDKKQILGISTITTVITITLSMIIFLVLTRVDVDITKEPMEVAPTAHHFMGGVKINENCESSIANLYAAGEASGGVHGANRLGGNALADTQVFGKIAGENAAKAAKTVDFEENPEMFKAEEDRIKGLIKDGSIKPQELKKRIKQLMWEKVSIIRNEKNLNEALKELMEMEKSLNDLKVEDKKQYNTDLQTALEVINMIQIATLVVKSAILRRESRGAHFREDYPETKDEWKKSIVLNKNKIKFENR